MADGIQIFEALELMDNQFFDKMELTYDLEDPFRSYRNYHAVIQGLTKFYKILHGYQRNDVQIDHFLHVFTCIDALEKSLDKLRMDIEDMRGNTAFINVDNMVVILEMALGLSVNCENTENIIAQFTYKLEDHDLDDLMVITKEVL